MQALQNVLLPFSLCRIQMFTSAFKHFLDTPVTTSYEAG